MLLLDLGNSRLKWRIGRGAVRADARDDYRALVDSLTPGMPALLASTAPAAVCDELIACLAAQRVVPRRVGVRDGFLGLRLAYAEPAALGVDRWLALLAARRRCPGRSVIVLSAGTALTADAVAPDGGHLGGYIAPGVGAAARALPEQLAPLAMAGAIQPGRTTAECVSAGYSSLFIGALSLWRQGFCLADAELLVSGGDGERLLEWCAALGWQGAYYPDMVLEGLGLVGEGGREVSGAKK